MTNLIYDLHGAYDHGVKTHPERWMRDNKIKYSSATPCILSDLWEFIGCVLPDGFELPDFLEVVD